MPFEVDRSGLSPEQCAGNPGHPAAHQSHQAQEARVGALGVECVRPVRSSIPSTPLDKQSELAIFVSPPLASRGGVVLPPSPVGPRGSVADSRSSL